MYSLPKRYISQNLQNRVSGYLETDAASREKLKEDVKEFYGEQSASVHDRKEKASTQKNREAFAKEIPHPTCLGLRGNGHTHHPIFSDDVMSALP